MTPTYKLTLDDAKKIREWRCGKPSHSWRMVAARAAEEWPKKGIYAGNQIDGMELCREAAELLNEDWNEGPWN